MLLRQLSPGTATAQSWSTTVYLSQRMHGKAPCLYRGANLRFGCPKHEKQLHFSRPYSNYAPKGPPPYYNPYHNPYYNPYGQPPRSRISRFKDIAIGSVLTIIALFAYGSYYTWPKWKAMREAEKLTSDVQERLDRYDWLLKKAEAGDDGSAESAEKIRRLLKERAIFAVRAFIPKEEEFKYIMDLGPLPRLPQDYACECRERQGIEDDDTLMLMPSQESTGEIKGLKWMNEDDADGRSIRPIHPPRLLVAVNAFSKDMGTHDPEEKITQPGASKLHEVICRSAFILDNLHNKGIVNGPTLVIVLLRDGIFSFICEESGIWIVHNDHIHRADDGHFVRQ
ncbi:hypothetical protein F5Y12DRAFT_352926 [Xylaria sp. FL1777]|nr:hypothetical protein F5Y12DRAFT_352926 [Xylaria sp. FL1777]